DAREAASCQRIAYAYARDVGMSGLRALQVASTAARLAEHALTRDGGGMLELLVVTEPRLTLQLRVSGPAGSDDLLPLELLSWPLDSNEAVAREDPTRESEVLEQKRRWLEIWLADSEATLDAIEKIIADLSSVDA